MRTHRLALAAVLFLGALHGRADTVVVSVTSNSFVQSDVTVTVGDRVRWEFLDGVHSSTSDTPALWNSGLLMPGTTFERDFLTIGNFPYHCTAHGAPGGFGMSGIIRVQGAPTPTPTRTPTATPTVTPTPTITPIPTPEAFHSVEPCRLLDTRDTPGPFGGPALAAGASRNFTIAGQCGVPVTARSVSLNVTVTQPTAPGHLTLYPAGQGVPLVSVINFRAGQTRANNAIVKLGTGGAIAVQDGQSAGTVHFIADVNGWFE